MRCLSPQPEKRPHVSLFFFGYLVFGGSRLFVLDMAFCLARCGLRCRLLRSLALVRVSTSVLLFSMLEDGVCWVSLGLGSVLKLSELVCSVLWLRVELMPLAKCLRWLELRSTLFQGR